MRSPTARRVIAKVTGIVAVHDAPSLAFAPIHRLTLIETIALAAAGPLLIHAVQALPVIMASSIALIAVCGCFAAVLVLLGGFDPLTAYLPTSPGGADPVAIFAATAHVDKPFVMTMQMTRLVVVLIVGPSLSRFIAGRFYWGMFNLLWGVFLLSRHPPAVGPNVDFLAPTVGALAIGTFLALHFGRVRRSDPSRADSAPRW